MRIKLLIEQLTEVEEPRRKNKGHYLHKLEDILVIGLLTIICRGQDYTDMEDFGDSREEWLKQFLELPNGIPDSDTFRRVFERVNPVQLMSALNHWIAVEREKRAVIAIDGKSIRGSANSEHRAVHVVSAWVVENQITLGQLATDEKSNEITAVPELLDMIDISGAIITADAMSCQKKIVEKITGKGADYVIALKANQGTFLEDAALFFSTEAEHTQRLEMPIEKGHGRIEQRSYYLATNIGWLPQLKDWDGLRGIGMACSRVTEKGVIREDTRYFITSLTDVNEFAQSVRKHWSIESMHWCLDMVFREDACRAKVNHSPENLNIMRKIAMSLLKKHKTPRKSYKSLMFIASLNSDFLLNTLFEA